MAPAPVDEAFLAMVNEYRAAIHRVTRAYAAPGDDRRELFQEIVYQLWRTFPRFRGDASRMTWVYRVALNTAISSTRRRRRVPEHVPMRDEHHPVVAALSTRDDSRGDRLSRALHQLTDAERALMTCYLDDMSYERIAQVLGISESNVGVRLHRVKAKLQRVVRAME
jgi:RNA polymerase sigma-70 factor (ECF subfamily)